jgi:hypothetical protein
VPRRLTASPAESEHPGAEIFLKIATNFVKSSLSKAINGFKRENKLTKMTNISIVKKAE